MDTVLSKPLSQIVNERHEAASVFEKYNLDYYYRGKRSLKEACEENRVATNEVVEALQNIYGSQKCEVDFNKIKLSQLIDYITYTHHAYIKKQMAKILARLEKLHSIYGTNNELYQVGEL